MEISKQTKASRVTVTKWRNRYLEKGLDGLLDASRTGRPRTIPMEKIEQVVQKTINEKPKDRTHWSVRSMAKETGISKSKISLIWQAHELRPHMEATFKLSKDPKFTEKLKDVAGLYMSPPANADWSTFSVVLGDVFTHFRRRSIPPRVQFALQFWQSCLQMHFIHPPSCPSQPRRTIPFELIKAPPQQIDLQICQKSARQSQPRKQQQPAPDPCRRDPVRLPGSP